MNEMVIEDNLRLKKEYTYQTLCVMCAATEKSVRHIFFECLVANHVWNSFNKWSRIISAHHNQTKQHFDQFCISGLNNKANLVSKIIRVVFLKCIWEQMNIIVINNGL